MCATGRAQVTAVGVDLDDLREHVIVRFLERINFFKNLRMTRKKALAVRGRTAAATHTHTHLPPSHVARVPPEHLYHYSTV